MGDDLSLHHLLLGEWEPSTGFTTVAAERGMAWHDRSARHNLEFPLTIQHLCVFVAYGHPAVLQIAALSFSRTLGEHVIAVCLLFIFFSWLVYVYRFYQAHPNERCGGPLLGALGIITMGTFVLAAISPFAQWLLHGSNQRMSRFGSTADGFGAETDASGVD